MRGGVAEVVQLLSAHFDKTLPALYAAVRNADATTAGSTTSSSAVAAAVVTREQLDRLLLGCNRLIRSSGSWRSHECVCRRVARHIDDNRD